MIKANAVYVNGKVIQKPSFEISETDKAEIKGQTLKYVSRGGLKLEKAIECFKIDISGKVCADIGSSTGGFTDCLLQNGAEYVYAIDSGSDQLHDKLRNDERVCVMEHFNARNLSKRDLSREIQIVTMDVSFISQTVLFPNVSSLLDDGGVFISLIKPQFEVGKEYIGKGGIVKDEKQRAKCIENIKAKAEKYGLIFESAITSPITGGDGNTEYLALFLKNTKKTESGI